MFPDGGDGRSESPMANTKIVVAMSGGVDSSLAAALLRDEGHEVWGISLRVWEPERCRGDQERTCCSARDIRDARRVAAGLGIPFSSWDLRAEFEQEVIAPFVSEYRDGRTPNPCILCNSRIKFGLLLEKARQMGADGVATGHYARVTLEQGEVNLRKGADRSKDQSYVLFGIGRECLPRVRFPLGNLTKEEVRQRARSLGLDTAEKKESQEICFIPGNDYGTFVAGRLEASDVRPGPILDTSGRRRGTHRGLIHYTVGQRRGLGIAGGEPLYVLRLHRRDNTLVVGGSGELASGTCPVAAVTWLSREPRGPFRCTVKIRYRHPGAPAEVVPAGDGCLVRFDAPQRAVTPGQAAVFYEGDRVLGGGWIDADP